MGSFQSIELRRREKPCKSVASVLRIQCCLKLIRCSALSSGTPLCTLTCSSPSDLLRGPRRVGGGAGGGDTSCDTPPFAKPTRHEPLMDSSDLRLKMALYGTI